MFRSKTIRSECANLPIILKNRKLPPKKTACALVLPHAKPLSFLCARHFVKVVQVVFNKKECVSHSIYCTYCFLVGG